MKPFELTPEILSAAKAAARAKFGHDRLIGIDYRDPITGELLTVALFADLTIADASAYFDGRLDGIVAARDALFLDRIMFPDQDAIEALRETWPEFDRSLETELRREIGFIPGKTSTLPLTAATAPPGLDPALVPGMLEAAAGIRLWAISRPVNGLACVLRQPQRAIYDLSATSYGEAWSAKRGVLTSWLDVIEDHAVWSPAPTLRAHLTERVGRLEDLGAAWNTMGGAGAKTSARRF